MTTTFYNYLDYFANQYRKVKCEVESTTGKTAMIRLLEFGPKGNRPGTRMRVHLKSLDSFRAPKPSAPDTSWREYCYSD